MNFLEQLRDRVEGLPDGEHRIGLKAVLQHVEVAQRHLMRGQKDHDDTAFTDAIYRTNQAFEGSLKEAYRVLAGKDPANETPNNIEGYLGRNNVLRERVLSQLRTYRRDWRNPSTHDYRLDFDEAEALLAIISVTGFTIVLVDQIIERLSFEHAKMRASKYPLPDLRSESLIDMISALIGQFVLHVEEPHTDGSQVRETEIIGSLAGYLTSSVPDLDVQVEARLSEKSRFRADLLVASAEERLILEIKRGLRLKNRSIQDAVDQVSAYMLVSGIRQAIIFNDAGHPGGVINQFTVDVPEGRILVISTEMASSGTKFQPSVRTLSLGDLTKTGMQSE